MEKAQTNRGFGLYEFKDRYQTKCSLQKSSMAFEDTIWLGVDSADPKIMAKDAIEHGIAPFTLNGWVDYPIPKEVSLTTRMHLTRKQVGRLLPKLIKFFFTGRI